MPSSTTGVLPWRMSSSFAAIDVDADDVVAVAREARERNGADVAEAENADLHALPFHFIVLVVRTRAGAATRHACAAIATARC